MNSEEQYRRFLGQLTFIILTCVHNHQLYIHLRAALGEMVIVVENGFSDTSSKPWTKLFAFHPRLITFGKV